MRTHRHTSQRCQRCIIGVIGVAALAVGAARPAQAQRAEDNQAPALPSDSLFPHDDLNHWISGQMNVIAQGHPGFHAQYTGEQSLLPNAEAAVSFVGTLFTGFRPTPMTDAIADIELAAGNGISRTFGLGGFTNLDVVRNPTLSAEPYVARLMLRRVFALSDTWVDVDRGPLQLAPRLPLRRLEIAIGKLATPDFFDRNNLASDSHRQFMNWTVDNTGAYDYAADTRGYTYGIVTTYESPRFAARFGLMLMPQVANGIQFDWNIANSRAENLEVELRYHLGRTAGVARLLGYLNHANMGSYADAIAARDGDLACRAALEQSQMRPFPVGTPVIECHRIAGRLKGGVAFNFEQQIYRTLAAFGRFGWNDGHNESFAYTEVDSTVVVGLALTGEWWRRPADRLGAAFISNGLSSLHSQYLFFGGKGFLLGDGTLTYGRETITEAYYTLDLGRGSSVAADAQFIVNPGYNQVRGPVIVGALRFHQEL